MATDRRSQVLGAILVVGVIIGFVAWSARGAEIDRLESEVDALKSDAEQAGEFRKGLDRQVTVCGEAVRRARGAIRSEVAQHLELYDTAQSWVAQAFRLGLDRDFDEVSDGLGRAIAEQEQFYEQLPARDLGDQGWFGWGVVVDRTDEIFEERNIALDCLGINPEDV